ncbi:unnamed protein product [Amoebophrya sp. A25]|nr:unnamed protein product [Amoebophrya sp. A25]|eukprot:GSA25T00024975001.1
MSDSTRGVPGTSVVPEPGSGGNGDSQRKRVAFVESQPADAKPPKQKKGPTTSSKDAVQEFNAPEQSPVKKQFRMAAVELGNENQPLGAGNSGAGGAASTGGSGKSSKRSEPASKPPEPFDRSKISIDDPISAAEAAIDMQYDAPAKRRRGGFADKLVDSVGVKETRIRQSQLHCTYIIVSLVLRWLFFLIITCVRLIVKTLVAHFSIFSRSNINQASTSLLLIENTHSRTTCMINNLRKTHRKEVAGRTYITNNVNDLPNSRQVIHNLVDTTTNSTHDQRAQTCLKKTNKWRDQNQVEDRWWL